MMSAELPVVLHVEDEPAHAELVRRSLEECHPGCRIVHVADGQEAMDYFLRQGKFGPPADTPRPAVVLLDWRLPRVDGVEVLRFIKSAEGTHGVPVVVLSTSATDSDLAQAYAERANSYLVKPVSFDMLTQMLEAFASFWLSWNCRLDE